jgi:hypothetical protein
MKTVSLALLLALAVPAGSVLAQSPANAEINPPGYTPSVQHKATADEKAQGKALRKETGAVAARDDTPAEGKPMPDATARVAREERRAARAERKAESRRANKAGEITSKGEVGLAK